jgi:hypothetical protein
MNTIILVLIGILVIVAILFNQGFRPNRYVLFNHLQHMLKDYPYAFEITLSFQDWLEFISLRNNYSISSIHRYVYGTCTFSKMINDIVQRVGNNYETQFYTEDDVDGPIGKVIVGFAEPAHAHELFMAYKDLFPSVMYLDNDQFPRCVKYLKMTKRIRLGNRFALYDLSACEDFIRRQKQ